MLVADGNGTPIACHLASANSCELDLAKTTLEKVAVRTGSGRTRKRPGEVVADKGYDARRFRRYLRSRGIKACVPARVRTDRFRKRGRPYATDFATYAKRWKIERTFAWLGQFRRLIVRHENILDVYQGFFHIDCLIISIRVLLK